MAVPVELFRNNAVTTLAADITDVATTITVTDGTVFSAPLSGRDQFRILIDSEILLVTNVVGNTLTVERHQESTIAVAHFASAVVTQILTSLGLLSLPNNFNYVSTYAEGPRPSAAGYPGRVWRPSDVPYIYIDNGTSWDRYFLNYKLTNPPTSGWTWANQNVWTATAEYDHLKFTNSGGSTGVGMYYRTAPATPYKITAAFVATPGINASLFAFGLGFRSSDGKISSFERMVESGLLKMGAYKYDSPTSVNAAYYDKIGYPACGPLLFLRIEDDGTNRKWSVSQDGVNFYEWQSVLRTDFHTPTQVGVVGFGNSALGGFNLISWLES